jgi:hypothetical protein
MAAKFLRRRCSPSTANKRLGHLRGLLRWAHKLGWRGPVPDCERVAACRADQQVWLTRDQFAELLASCEVATWPAGRATSAAHQWRSLIVFRCCYGLRVHEAFAVRKSHRPLKWSHVHPPGRTPLRLGQCDWPSGWLSYVPAKQQREKPGAVVLPLHAECRRWLLELGPRSLQPEYPVWNWPASPKLYGRTWAAIRAEALRRTGAELFEGLQFEQLRESAATLHYQISRSAEIARAVLGHAPRDVSSTHYVSIEQTLCEHFGNQRLAEYLRWP